MSGVQCMAQLAVEVGMLRLPRGARRGGKGRAKGAHGSGGPTSAVFCGALQAGGLVGARSAQLSLRSLRC